jgi:hypothetical protein
VGGHLKRPPYFLRAETKSDRAARSTLLALISTKAISVKRGAVRTHQRSTPDARHEFHRTFGLRAESGPSIL